MLRILRDREEIKESFRHQKKLLVISKSKTADLIVLPWHTIGVFGGIRAHAIALGAHALQLLWKAFLQTLDGKMLLYIALPTNKKLDTQINHLFDVPTKLFFFLFFKLSMFKKGNQRVPPSTSPSTIGPGTIGIDQVMLPTSLMALKHFVLKCHIWRPKPERCRSPLSQRCKKY